VLKLVGDSPSTLVSPGRARFSTLSYSHPHSFQGLGYLFLSCLCFWSWPFEESLSLVQHYNHSPLLRQGANPDYSHGTTRDGKKKRKKLTFAMISRAPCLKRIKRAQRTPTIEVSESYCLTYPRDYPKTIKILRLHHL